MIKSSLNCILEKGDKNWYIVNNQSSPVFWLDASNRTNSFITCSDLKGRNAEPDLNLAAPAPFWLRKGKLFWTIKRSKSYLWCNFYQFLDRFESKLEIYQFWKEFWNFEIFENLNLKSPKIVRIYTFCPVPERPNLCHYDQNKPARALASHPCSKVDFFG